MINRLICEYDFIARPLGHSHNCSYFLVRVNSTRLLCCTAKGRRPRRKSYSSSRPSPLRGSDSLISLSGSNEWFGAQSPDVEVDTRDTTEFAEGADMCAFGED